MGILMDGDLMDGDSMDGDFGGWFCDYFYHSR